MDLVHAQPYWVLHLFPPEDLPFAAANELLQGREGEALLELASLSRPTRLDVGDLFERALEEIGASTLSIDKAWRMVARDVIDRLDAREISPRQAGSQLAALHYSADYPKPLSAFGALDDYLEVGLLSDEQWEIALVQEAAALRKRLERRASDEEQGAGSGALYWLRKYGVLRELS